MKANMIQKLKDFWNKNRVIVWIVGAVVMFFEYRKFLQSSVVAGGKAAVEEATKKDEVLAKEEQSANTQADALVEKAKEEPLKETQVGTDWNKK